MLTMKITVISGTNRIGANSLKISHVIADLYSKEGVEVQVLNLQELPKEIFDPSIYSQKPKPASFLPFQEAITNADGLVMVIPEYNGSYPGVLKYFIDMLSYPDSFDRQPIAFVGLSSNMWGALRPVEHMQGVWGYRNAFIFNERVFISNIWSEIDSDGQLKKELTKELVVSQTKNFCAFIRGLKTQEWYIMKS
jgi:chromate reductase, NAD(P)H dehydrogenase (quinone)